MLNSDTDLSVYSPGVFCDVLFVFEAVDDVERVADVAPEQLDSASVFDVRHARPPVVDEPHDPPEDHVALLARGDGSHVVHFGPVHLEQAGKGELHPALGTLDTLGKRKIHINIWVF